MKLIFTILLPLLATFSSCSNNSVVYEKKMKIIHYNNGVSDTINVSEEQKKKVEEYLKKLFVTIEEELRLYLDSERIETIKAEDETLEFIFTEDQTISVKNLYTIKFDRVIIPISGDLSVTENNNDAVVVFGDKEYGSSPHLAAKGKLLLKKIIKELKISQ